MAGVDICRFQLALGCVVVVPPARVFHMCLVCCVARALVAAGCSSKWAKAAVTPVVASGGAAATPTSAP